MKNARPVPILSCRQAETVESELLRDESENWSAIMRAGTGCAARFLDEFGARLPERPRILALIGKGHNGADASVAAREIIAKFPGAKIAAAHAPEGEMRKLALRAFRQLESSAPDMEKMDLSALPALASRRASFDIMIEGLVGMNFRPPAKPHIQDAIRAANEIEASVKISMDIPAGASEGAEAAPVFRADATYANGIAKSPLFEERNLKFAGRIRYVDTGFFEAGSPAARQFEAEAAEFIARPKMLAKLNALRNAQSDKRTYGHLWIFAGSERFPGAAMLNAAAAVRAGVGIVTAFVPKSLVPGFAAALPSAIWAGCEVGESGQMLPENLKLLEGMKPPTAILAGSGLTSAEEAREFVAGALAKFPEVPRVLDADAITPQLAKVERRAPLLMTPHAGEFLRLAPRADDECLRIACKEYGAHIALKGHITRVCGGGAITRCTEGGPILSRGGSGDVLAGICGALAGRTDLEMKDGEEILCCASMWLGLAAECAFAEFGENAATGKEVADRLGGALKLI